MRGAVLADHLNRSAHALRGFRFLGLRWLPMWLAYVTSPLIRLAWPGTTLNFRHFTARVHSTDLYCLANIFYDYDAGLLAQTLDRVDQVVDAGANVGSFSFLVTQLAGDRRPAIRITAVEPEQSNFALLREQPFARDIECLNAAVGPHSGQGRLIRGENAATHQVVLDHDGLAGGEAVTMITLDELCRSRTLLKMDIEGGEWKLLAGLPRSVVALFLECHAGGPSTDPRQLVTVGTWRLLSNDIYGNSTWFWIR